MDKKDFNLQITYLITNFDPKISFAQKIFFSFSKEKFLQQHGGHGKFPVPRHIFWLLLTVFVLSIYFDQEKYIIGHIFN